MSTSNPMSANPVAMTLPPRSWPSWPTLATRIRGRRPSLATNSCNKVDNIDIEPTLTITTTGVTYTQHCFTAFHHLNCYKKIFFFKNTKFKISIYKSSVLLHYKTVTAAYTNFLRLTDASQFLVIIGSDTGLEPDRHKTISSINDDSSPKNNMENTALHIK